MRTLLLVYFLSLLKILNANSFSQKDICKIISEGINNTPIENNWERIADTFNYSGITFTEKDENNEVFILRIHPQLYLDLQKEGIEQEIGITDKVLEINGKPVKSLTTEEITDETLKDEIKIKHNNSEKIFELKKKKYLEFPIYTSSKINNITNINSKNSSFDINLELITRYEHLGAINQLALLFKNNIKTETRNLQFTCPVKNPSLDIPVKIANFTPSENYKNVEQFYVFLPYVNCQNEDILKCNISNNNSELYIQNNYFFNGKVHQAFDLISFPFDKQNLHLTFFVSDIILDPTSQKLVPFDIILDEYFEEEVSRFVEDEAINQSNPEWKFKDHYETYGDIWNPFYKIKNITISQTFEVERNYLYYIYKLIFPVIFLVLISFSVYWINVKDLESRVTVSIVCLLSLIAYNFVIDEDLPKIGYLTLLDKIILISYVFAGMPTIQSIMGKYYYEKNKYDKFKFYDTYSKIYLPLSYFLSIFYLYINNI